MQIFLLILTLLIAIILLIMLIVVLGLWMKGVSSLAFPGLGLLVSTPLIFVLLLIAEIVLVLLAAYLVRYIPILRFMLDEMILSN